MIFINKDILGRDLVGMTASNQLLFMSPEDDIEDRILIEP